MGAIRIGAAVARALKAAYEAAGAYRRKTALSVIAALLLVFSLYGLISVPHASAATGLFSDDFEADPIGSVPSGWTVISGTSWSVQQDGSHVLKQNDTSTSAAHVIVAGSPSWTDYTLQASVKPGSNLTPSTVIMARFVDNNNHYSFIIKNNSEWWLGDVQGGNWNTLDNGNFTFNATTWYTMSLTVQGTTISAAINGVTLSTDTDNTFSSGLIGFSTKATSELDNVLVTTNLIQPTPTATATQPPTPTASATATATATNGHRDASANGHSYRDASANRDGDPVAHTDGDPTTNSDRDGDSVANGDANRHAVADSYPVADASADCNRDGDAITIAHANGYSAADTHAIANSYPVANGHGHAIADRDGDTYAVSDRDGYTIAHADGDANLWHAVLGQFRVRRDWLLAHWLDGRGWHGLVGAAGWHTCAEADRYQHQQYPCDRGWLRQLDRLHGAGRYEAGRQ